MALPVLTAEIPVLDGCPALTRLRAFVTPVGTAPILEHTFRDHLGNPVDLAQWFGEVSQSESETQAIVALLRGKEAVAPVSEGSNPLIELTGEVVDPAEGLVHFNLEPEQIPRAGVYELSLGVQANGVVRHVEQATLLVERSLFVEDLNQANYGPPTISEIRMALMDASREENALLDSVEFHNDQLAHAISRPIRQWNETPPPLRYADTRNFPFREYWLGAIIGQLLMIAAHNYRRNVLPTSAGGVTVSDKDKEREYNSAADKRYQIWMEWLRHKKLQINAGLFSGIHLSEYSMWKLPTSRCRR